LTLALENLDSGPKIRLLFPTVGLIERHTDCVIKDDTREIPNSKKGAD